ncbi:hypothetical protein [Micromonospora sp. NPDC050276]|uniref:hypothetical protein n=1 Tax=Micromonospora sp. NPDC050276 TaxID=3364278 RepID=UPI0037A5613A
MLAVKISGMPWTERRAQPSHERGRIHSLGTTLAATREDVAVIDALLRDIADRPVDLADPDWQVKLSAAAPPAQEAGVAAEAAEALTALLDIHEPDPVRLPQQFGGTVRW